MTNREPTNLPPKGDTIAKFRKHDTDTGSPEVQIALLTDRINHQVLIEPRPPGESRLVLRVDGRVVAGVPGDEDDDDPREGELRAPRKPSRPRARRGQAQADAALVDAEAEPAL